MIETVDYPKPPLKKRYSRYAAVEALRGFSPFPTNSRRCANGWLTYAVSAVDFWDGWVSVDDVLLRLKTGDYHLGVSASDVVVGLAESCFAASNAGWEGDVRRDPGVMVALVNGKLPTMPSHLCFGWKQDNNGDTFFTSRSYIPAIDEADITAPVLSLNQFIK